MLVHGMIDDNVHPQNTVRLIDALVDADKQFDLFMYPGRRHGVGGGHYNRMVFDFIMKYMDPTPPTGPEPETPPKPEPLPTEAQPEPAVVGPHG